MTGEIDHVRRNRSAWDEWSGEYEEPGRRAWASEERGWGVSGLLEQGALPNLQGLIDRGQKTVLRSTVPTHSWAAWPSFLTGVNPDDHGVYDILETVPGTHKQYPVTYKSIKARTFLSDLHAAGKE